MKSVRLCWHFLSTTLSSRMEYRYSFFMLLFVQVFTYSVNYLGIWIILDKFHQIQDWSFFEIVFLYNLNLFSYGLAGLFIWGPMRELENMIQQGTFDSLLIRPLNPLLHLIVRHFNAAFLGHLVLGGIIFVVCFINLNIDWTVIKAVWFVLVVLGAAAIQMSMMVMAGSSSFWFVKSLTLIDTTIYGVRRCVEYPISIYNTCLQVILTFIVPYAFVNYFPSRYFLNKAGESVFHPIFQYITPVVGVGMTILAYRIWNLGINRYQSTGS